jgi:hypothetical protein
MKEEEARRIGGPAPEAAAEAGAGGGGAEPQYVAVGLFGRAAPSGVLEAPMPEYPGEAICRRAGPSKREASKRDEERGGEKGRGKGENEKGKERAGRKKGEKKASAEALGHSQLFSINLIPVCRIRVTVAEIQLYPKKCMKENLRYDIL